MMLRGTALDAFLVSSAMWPGTSNTRMRYCAISSPFAMVYAVCPFTVFRPAMPDRGKPLVFAFWA